MFTCLAYALIFATLQIPFNGGNMNLELGTLTKKLETLNQKIGT